MRVIAAIAGSIVILVVLWDAFEAIVLPRRVTRRIRLTSLFYRITWLPWSAFARLMRKEKGREKLLSFFGPLSLLMLLSVWAVGLVFGFALIQWAIGARQGVSSELANFGTDLYMSGTTFFTLGLGDVIPHTRLARAATVLEAGIGFGFLALVIGYLPVLYQAFSRREVNISLLDARAGTPPTAAELLRRHSESGNMQALYDLLHDWEHWSADLMESHLSYPVLCYFRSQHDNQSWVSSLTTILDTCALVMVGVDGAQAWQAQLTFKMARHTVVDLSQIFNTSPREPRKDRLGEVELARLRTLLTEAGVPLREGTDADQNLHALRHMYEPYVNSLAEQLMMPLPPWSKATGAVDNWQTSAWERNPAASDSALRKCTLKDARNKSVTVDDPISSAKALEGAAMRKDIV